MVLGPSMWPAEFTGACAQVTYRSPELSIATGLKSWPTATVLFPLLSSGAWTTVSLWQGAVPLVLYRVHTEIEAGGTGAATILL